MYLLKHARPGSYILNDTICKVINVHMNIHGLRREPPGPPSVVSGRGYCLQTPHLELRRYGHFVRKSADPPGCRVEKGCNRSTSTVLYACVHLDAWLSNITGVRLAEVLENWGLNKQLA